MSVLCRIFNTYSTTEHLLHARNSAEFPTIFIGSLWSHKAVSTTLPKSHSAPLAKSQVRKLGPGKLGTYTRSHSKSEGTRTPYNNLPGFVNSQPDLRGFLGLAGKLSGGAVETTLHL